MKKQTLSETPSYEITEGTEEDYNFTTPNGREVDYWKISIRTEKITEQTLENSVYEITESTEDDYNFTTPNGSGKDYWKININTENLCGNNVTFSNIEEAGSTGSITVNLPNEKIETLYYTYNQPDDYTETNERINNTLTADNVNKKLFKDIIGSESVSAVYNTFNNENANIVSDFINNSVIRNDIESNIADTIERNYGVIYNNGTSAKIGDILSNFIENIEDIDFTSNLTIDTGASSYSSRKQIYTNAIRTKQRCRKNLY